MNTWSDAASIAGQEAAYDLCPDCGHTRVRHGRRPGETCAQALHAETDPAASPPRPPGSLCGCPLNRDWQAPIDAEAI